MPSKQARLNDWLRARGEAEIQLADVQTLLDHLKPISESTLRHYLRNSGAVLHPLAAGVNQDTLADLRASLSALSACYENGDADTRRTARRIVITAKDHAKLAAHNEKVAAEKRELKEEMVAWMLTWLENPAIFPIWASLKLDRFNL